MSKLAPLVKPPPMFLLSMETQPESPVFMPLHVVALPQHDPCVKTDADGWL
jgi:hypothetical protein